MNERAAAMRAAPPTPTSTARSAAVRAPTLLPPSVTRGVALEQRAGMALDQQTPAADNTGEDPDAIGQREEASSDDKDAGSSDGLKDKSDDDKKKPSDDKPDDDDPKKDSDKKLPGEVTRDPVWFDGDPGPGWTPTTGPQGQPHDQQDKGDPPPILDMDNTDDHDTPWDDHVGGDEQSKREVRPDVDWPKDDTPVKKDGTAASSAGDNDPVAT